jgi:uncharacterized Zn-binding protein involved in type VI secretion
MGMPAARVSDLVLQLGPHCHAPIHPALPIPTPAPHPPMDLPIIPPGGATVMIGGLPAARMTDQTQPCDLAGCVPGGPGIIVQASATVLIGGLGAARVGDMTAHAACVAPIPAPSGKIMPPGCATVLIGG